jgi:hypothetical protein
MAQRTLHLAGGGSGAACLRQALGVPDGDVLEHCDVLSVGPLPPIEDVRAWAATRRAFWSRIHANDEWDLAGPDLQRLHDCDALHVWAGTSVADQLRLPWLVARTRREGIPLPLLGILQFEAIERERALEILDLGMLSPQMLNQQRSSPRLVAPHEVEHLAEVWSALTAPEPDDLLALAAQPSTPFPYLQRALRTTIGRYPDKLGGLSHWDRRS